MSNLTKNVLQIVIELGDGSTQSLNMTVKK